MATCTMRFRAIDASGYRTYVDAATNILTSRHRFKVRRVYARTVAAEMIKVQAWRNGAAGPFERYAVSRAHALSGPESSISIGLTSDPCPAPAKRRVDRPGDLVDLSPESKTRRGVHITPGGSASRRGLPSSHFHMRKGMKAG